MQSIFWKIWSFEAKVINYSDLEAVAEKLNSQDYLSYPFWIFWDSKEREVWKAYSGNFILIFYLILYFHQNKFPTFVLKTFFLLKWVKLYFSWPFICESEFHNESITSFTLDIRIDSRSFYRARLKVTLPTL